MSKLKLSYTSLRLWELGEKERVVDMFAKTSEQLDTPEIVEGQAWDQLVKESIEKEGKLPKEMGDVEIKNAEPGGRVEVDLNEDFTLVIKPDIVKKNRSVIYEFKTGKYDSSAYSRTMQVPIYLFGVSEAERGIILHYDQALEELDWFLIHKTDTLMNKTRDYILQNGGEIKDYLESQGIK